MREFLSIRRKIRHNVCSIYIFYLYLYLLKDVLAYILEKLYECEHEDIDKLLHNIANVKK